jgi:hypothetical protein
MNDFKAFLFVILFKSLLLEIVDFGFSFSIASCRDVKSGFNRVSNLVFVCAAFFSPLEGVRLNLDIHIIIVP